MITTTGRTLLIGVDVGGTNSDLVVLDPTKLDQEERGVIAWHKSVTTPDVSVGIEKAIEVVLENPANNISKEEIATVTIGTTHFINAVIERDSNRLEKVAVLRLSGPFGRSLPPFGDFPDDLEEIIHGYHAFIDGGSRLDCQDIKPLDEDDIRAHCKKIKELGIGAIAVVGTFASMNPKHELRTKEIILEELPDVEIALSHTISGLGFVERENATILNASIKRFGRKIIKSFVHATKRIGLNCTVLLSQNDGTVLSVKEALETPIRTFSSGATNSMRGAAILCSADPDVKGKNVMVCDVGGTTTDVGQLEASGFPRQSSTYSHVGGVRMNFSMPQVESIGLGGGSIVRFEDGEMTVGPDSTGADIVTRSIVFGGDTFTTSDVTIAEFVDQNGVDKLPATLSMGNPTNVLNKFDSEFKKGYKAVVRKHLERVIDRMKTSREPIPVIFVGGGSFIAPEELEGASKVIKPPYFQVANAIGAALGQISSSITEVRTLTSDAERKVVIDELVLKAKSDVIRKGALESSVTVVNIVSDAMPYLNRVYKFEIKVVGTVDYTKPPSVEELTIDDNEIQGDYETEEIFKSAQVSKTEKTPIDYENYRPNVKDGIWILSEVDVDLIGTGAYILGCGGGGNPHAMSIELKNMIRNGAQIKVVTLDKFSELTNGEGRISKVGYMGSPIVSNERLPANEILDCLDLIEKHEGIKLDGIANDEIGGSNGLTGPWAAAKRGVYFVDIDSMGRAYPTFFQTIPSVINKGKGYPYSVISNGNGLSVVVTSTVDDFQLEDVLRDVLYNQGIHGGFGINSVAPKQAKIENALNTVSLSWRIGRAIYNCRAHSDLDNVPQAIIDAAGGSCTAKYLFQGKIVGVEKIVKRGYGYGVVEIEGLGDEFTTTLRIPFKNENIVVYKTDKHGKESILCSAPDLIQLVDIDGNAVGTQDYRYGLIVHLLAFAPADQWNTPYGIEVGGPKGFGEEFADIEYNPVGEYILPYSVCDEFNQD